MTNLDTELLTRMASWLAHGEEVALATVTAVHGSSSRQPGAMLAVTTSGAFVGSVSGGCVDEAIIRRVREKPPARIERLSYGGGDEAGHGLWLSCGGVIDLLLEPVRCGQWVESALEAVQEGRFIQRTLTIEDGSVTLSMDAAGSAEPFTCDAQHLVSGFGPAWRLILIGANQTSACLTRIAQLLNYQVIVCEPRSAYRANWDFPQVPCRAEVPDVVLRELKLDRHSAVVGLSHDPQLDDLALREALQSEAFYIGVMGSHQSQALRRERLQRHFGVTARALSRLHAPVGLPLGSKRPDEIALAVIAEITALRHGKSFVLQHAP